MQLSLPLAGTTQTAPTPVVFVRHRRARRYVLRVLRDGTLRVTIPRWGAKREAQAFVEANRAWIAEQRLRRQSVAPVDESWREGTQILVDGREIILRLEPSATGPQVVCDGERIAIPCPVPPDVRPFVEAWLRKRAQRILPGMLLELAAAHGITVGRVSVRNQRSRWGSCSPNGTITLNWRLIQTPPFVRDYVLLHELMHRREMNHSRRFWRLVATCCPGHTEARQWLRKEGKRLWSESG